MAGKKAAQILAVTAFIAGYIGCSGKISKDFLGSAVVEIQTTQAATTVSGPLIMVNKEEGEPVVAGEIIAVIDTIPFHLKRAELAATAEQLAAHIAASRAGLSSGEADLSGAKREFDRIGGLVDKGSAPSQQKDALKTTYESAFLKMKSSQLSAAALLAQKDAIDAQRATLEDQIRRCVVKAIKNGLVISTFKRVGEISLPGQPIYELGKYDTVQVDFFVPQTLLAQLKPGLGVRIRIDNQDGAGQFVPATIVWISNDAEFSPKNIQTRQSRNELVFKVRALAANPALLLKRGLPVEVWR